MDRKVTAAATVAPSRQSADNDVDAMTLICASSRLGKDAAAERSKQALPLSEHASETGAISKSAHALAHAEGQLPDLALGASSLPPAMMQSAKAASAASSASAQAVVPAEQDACIWPPSDRWDYDYEQGVAHNVRTRYPPRPRMWGLCPMDMILISCRCYFTLMVTIACVLGVQIYRRSRKEKNSMSSAYKALPSTPGGPSAMRG